jgi:catechol 2,3-dioxygenase-like lactoylglutathione lyase family enzyme
MPDSSRPGPKPKRLYGRWVRVGSADRSDWPSTASLRAFLRELDRVGRLVAHGPMTEPPGDLLLFRASSLREAERVIRADPFRGLSGIAYDLWDWNPTEFGSGVNLEPPPPRGAGRLTALQRVAVVVRDLERSMAWYTGVLGLRVREHDPETGYVELSLGRGASAISLVAPRPEWGEPYYTEALGRIGQSTGVVFQTDSVRALELRLEHAGARITARPASQPWGGRTLRFSDPDGNEFLGFEPAESSARAGGSGRTDRRRARETADREPS